LSLNLRLIALVAALLAVTIGSIAVVSTRLVHYEVRKLEMDLHHGPPLPSGDSLRNFYLSHRSWNGVQPVLDAVARSAGANVVLFDGSRRFVAASPPSFRPLRSDLTADGTLTYDTAIAGGRVREVVRGPQRIVRDASGAIVGQLFVMPQPDAGALSRSTRALDRWLFWTFSAAALFGIAMAVLIARWVTVPIERLTDAARRMEQGDLSVRVDAAGGPELSELARGFNAMAAALDRNEELRRRMVSDVAHELRAPLTNIRCELESMQDGLTTATQERIASLHQETMHLARLVDDLQDLALAEAGRLEIHPEKVALSALVRRAAPGIVAEGPEELMVMADPTRTVQILTNLLSNAITHSAGDVRIEWSVEAGPSPGLCRPEGRHLHCAVVRVIDSGPGIPADQLPHIFERFYRVDPSRSRDTGGAGLGLSIVRQLVMAQGGRVWAESAVGRGSIFSFTLPLAPS
jgi:signal transduction histidine kinase